jgi:hypothetical protein
VPLQCTQGGCRQQDELFTRIVGRHGVTPGGAPVDGSEEDPAELGGEPRRGGEQEDAFLHPIEGAIEVRGESRESGREGLLRAEHRGAFGAHALKFHPQLLEGPEIEDRSRLEHPEIGEQVEGVEAVTTGEGTVLHGATSATNGSDRISGPQAERCPGVGGNT